MGIRLKLLIFTAYCAVAICASFISSDVHAQSRVSMNPQDYTPRTTFRPLSPTELNMGKSAWAYFTQNTDPDTGLVSAVKNFPSMTLWDCGAYFLAVTSAYRLGIISRSEASLRIKKALISLASLPLYKNKFPNKAYNTNTLKMTDYANEPIGQGIGYSALDIMRLLSGMVIATQEFPEHVPLAKFVIDRWDLRGLVQDGRFFGVTRESRKKDRPVQEGRIGYEQYAATIGMRLGMPVNDALDYNLILRWQQFFDIRLPGDKRTAKTHGISSVTTSEPFILEVLEYGWRDTAKTVTQSVVGAQHYRFKTSGILTALSEDHMNKPPYFSYNGVLVDFDPFHSVTAQRKDASFNRSFSTKAAIGWWAIVDHPYTTRLKEEAMPLSSTSGWLAGQYERDGSPNTAITLNTNAVILEALHYVSHGPLYRR